MPFMFANLGSSIRLVTTRTLRGYLKHFQRKYNEKFGQHEILIEFNVDGAGTISAQPAGAPYADILCYFDDLDEAMRFLVSREVFDDMIAQMG